MTINMSQKILKEKLEAVRDLVDECLKELGSNGESASPRGVAPAEARQKPTTDKSLNIVNKVGDCGETDAIQKEILDKRGAEGRVLLSFYISYKYLKNEWLTSGDVEKITSDLGVKIDKKNASNYLTTFRKYLESGATRKRGQPTPYRLNRNGAKRFEEIINAKESRKGHREGS
ncbi:MAG: hypothetical protein ACD_63C00056G0002 [uncultured bacterium]|uniref:Uncharacterized protein n=1 Tax=Candidatus Terrybacteria bacterium RIFCSPLOWO2_01_FULL_58_14 TaxID=1802369 RepID=A0A1G2Q0P5_9BACT|nr:MAG: hypothetical protein ACD_63C00056G0002 [uncultured bacterium]OHA54147.1 MAG: hypothetical protein A2991_02635 [Candidatus Terrybacteria bacterium RIFCSPLOWO2_01_FULL_58_14]